MKRDWSSGLSVPWVGGGGASRLEFSCRGLSLGRVTKSMAPAAVRPYGVTSWRSGDARGRKSPVHRQARGEVPMGNAAAAPGDSAIDEDPQQRQKRLEAVLLLAKAPLSPRKLSQLAHLADATEARTLVRQLNRTYDRYGRAMRVEQVAGGYRMLTRPSLAPWLARLGHLPPPVRLSTPMMETLAVVAYRQPVSRASAEAVRGVACGELLRQLMERELIRIVGRGEELGRPYLYGTTKRFLQLFGLPSAEALPPIEWQTLHDDPVAEDSPDDLSTSTKEPVVSTAVAPVLSEVDPESVFVAGQDAPPSGGSTRLQQSPVAVDEEEEDEDEYYDDEEDDEEWDDDDDWDDEEVDDEELDDDDELEDEDDLDDDELDDEDDGWEEVDDEEADEEADDEDDEDEDDDDWDEDDEDWDDEDVEDEEDEDDEDWD